MHALRSQGKRMRFPRRQTHRHAFLLVSLSVRRISAQDADYSSFRSYRRRRNLEVSMRRDIGGIDNLFIDLNLTLT